MEQSLASPLYGKRLHHRVILSMPFANSKLRARSSEPRAFLKKLVWRPAGTMSGVSPGGRRAEGPVPSRRLQGNCPVPGWDHRQPCPYMTPEEEPLLRGTACFWHGGERR